MSCIYCPGPSSTIMVCERTADALVQLCGFACSVGLLDKFKILY